MDGGHGQQSAQRGVQPRRVWGGCESDAEDGQIDGGRRQQLEEETVPRILAIGQSVRE